jgi:hypothetical protein
MRIAARIKKRAVTGLAVTALLAGTAGAAFAAAQPGGPSASSTTAAGGRGSGQLAVDWNRELITLLGTPGLQPTSIHPTRSLAILQAAEYGRSGIPGTR